jgi:cytochrome P450
MGRLTLQVAGETLLSTDPSDDASVIASSLVTVLEETNDRLSAFWSAPLDWPLPRNRRYLAARAQLDRIVLEIIEERRRGQTSHDDLLQMFLEARDDVTGERMDDRQLRDEVMTMFVAGHETTSNALSWTLYLLSRFPSIGRALHDEATRVLGDRPATFDDLPKLELTRRVLQEAMRLYPPVWILSRSPSEDVEVDGYAVPARSLVFVSPWVTHRHPAFWDDPEGFDPDRFLPERMKKMHRHQYFPFSAGPRMCIGSTFAMMEGQLVLATIARRYRVDVLPGRAIVAEPLITLRPRGGIRASVHRIG